MTEESLGDLMIKISENKSFSVLENNVSKKTLEAISDKGFTEMTEIQAQSIPHLLSGRDLLGAAKTGSGKTLAFLIPVVELIKKLKFTRAHGTGAVIISPTRELAEQTYKVLEELSVQHKHTFGLLMGGVNKTNEIKMLTKGVNILIATPGRLLDHLNNTVGFVYKNLRCLVFDEADKILQNGFEKDINQILEIFPKKRQTILFSATQTQKTEDLARVSLKNPIYVGVDDNREHSTVEGLQQGYFVCPAEKKFLVLLATLIREQDKKVMVFFSTCLEVEFFSNLFEFIRFPVIAVHGQQSQSKRTETTSEFRHAKKSILLCTDVFGRGIDFESVGLIIQYDLPPNSEEYIHRVGRTARGQGGTGRALLFVLPEERVFLMYLIKNKIPIQELEINWSKIPNAQATFEKAISEVYDLHQLSKKAYKAYIRSYIANSSQKGLDVHKLDLKGVATSFGLREIPHIDIDIGGKKTKRPQAENLSKVPKKKPKVSNDHII